MSLGNTFMNKVVEGAKFLGAKSIANAAEKSIAYVGKDKGFGDYVIGGFRKRAEDNMHILQSLGKRSDQLDNWDIAKSAFMNDKGKMSNGRIAAGVAGAYMGANMIGHGSLGIPFISSASWNR